MELIRQDNIGYQYFEKKIFLSLKKLLLEFQITSLDLKRLLENTEYNLFASKTFNNNQR